MATASYPGQAMVQEPVAASSAAVVDLTSSQTPSEIASNGAKTGTGASVSQSKPGDPNGSTGEGSVTPGNVGVDESDEDGVDDVAIDGSLYEEILDEVEDFEYSKDGKDLCTAEEARSIRQRLHEIGISAFVAEYITSGKMTARKLCSAFGIRIPTFMEGLPDDGYYQLLGLAINRELNKRPRLEQYKTIDDAAMLLRKSSNIMVITGAGISTSLGIPDFRSKNTGFYSRLQELGYQEPEQVFDIHNFDDDPTIFYKLAGDILPDLTRWTPTHEFIRLLQDQNKLLTNYTQNIDNVEAHAGIRKEKLIQCHGSWATATCRKCKYRIPGEDIFENIRAHTPAKCPNCVKQIAEQKPGTKRKRMSNGNKKRRDPAADDSESDGAYDIPEPGIMKPDITFFGEALPDDFFQRLKTQDKDKVDLVIVMGTSMKVAPVSEIPNYLPRDIPQIYISRDQIHHINFDINLVGDCDTIVAELARRAGWDLKHDMIPKDQKVEITTVDEADHVYAVKAVTNETVQNIPST